MRHGSARYSRELADDICRRLAAGERLGAICALPGMPDRTTVFDWAVKDQDGFADRYDRARFMAADVMADEVIELADKATAENAHAVRLQVDARKWHLSKYHPKRFGDRVEISGGNIGGPLIAALTINYVEAPAQPEPLAIEGQAVRLPGPDQDDP